MFYNNYLIAKHFNAFITRTIEKKNFFFFEKNWEKFEKKKVSGLPGRAGLPKFSPSPTRAGLPGYSGPGFKNKTMKISNKQTSITRRF